MYRYIYISGVLAHYSTLHLTYAFVSMYMYTYMYIPICIHTFIHTNVQKSTHTDFLACTHTYLRTYMHTYTHTHPHTYTHTCKASPLNRPTPLLHPSLPPFVVSKALTHVEQTDTRHR